MPILKAENITKKFGKLNVLNGMNLSLQKGEVVAVIGPSGSGKSTFLRCLNKLERADGGNIMFDGEIIAQNGIYRKDKELRPILKKMGMVFQQFNLFPHKSVLQNITEAPICVNGMSRESAIAEARRLLSDVGLADKEKSYPCELSGGQQQRVSIARALALDPEILFFDEPTSALDPELTAEVLRVIKDLAAQNMTMVIVTHAMQFARDVADRVVFMDGGRIVEEGPAEQVIDHPREQRTREFLSRIEG